MSTEIRVQVSVVPATEDTSIAQWGQVKSLVNKFNKETVRAASTGPIIVSSALGILTPNPPLIDMDGVTLNDGDRVLLKDQLDSTVNGIYIVNVTDNTLTRSEDFADGSILMNNTGVYVAEGNTNGDKKFTVVSDGVLTVGTSSIIFTKEGSDSGLKRAVGDFSGDDSSKEFIVAHNFNLTDNHAYSAIVKNLTNGKQTIVHTTPTIGAEANSITITFDVAPSSSETFRVYLESLE